MSDNNTGSGFPESFPQTNPTAFKLNVSYPQAKQEQAPQQVWVSIHELKEQEQKQEELTVYVLQRDFRRSVRLAKMMAYELKLMGHPIAEEQEQDLNDLGGRQV